jgi:hypothetical protein
MNDQYLWDRTGDPDPEVRRLEKLLRPLADSGTPQRKRSRRRWMGWLALAASLLIGVAYLRWPEPAGWESTQGRVALGEWLNTTSPVQLNVAGIGRLDVAPQSRLRIESSRQGDYRVRLAQGKLDALILAPPREFFVETPGAVTVDLGCAYSLEVDGTGETRVSVRSGWVAFEKNGQEVFIPAGARCRTSPAFGLGVPVWADAPEELRASVEEFEESESLELPEELRAKDGLTLWHLLPRVSPALRAAVFDRFTRLVPNGVARERVIAGDRQALDSLWASLELGDSGLWRRWQRKVK